MTAIRATLHRLPFRTRTAHLALAVLLAVSLASGLASAAAPLNLPELNDYDAASVKVANAVRPGVVLIEVAQSAASGPTTPGRPSQPRRGTAEGSGVIIDPAGFILTNRHLVADATAVTVHMMGGAQYPGRVVGADALRDLAVVKIDAPRPLPAALLGDSDAERPGTWVMAVGFPFGDEIDASGAYEPSVTVGIISATGREIESDVQGESFRGLLQTDASINPGNSGGPLVNSHGEVIGINQAIYTPALVGANVGVGFAIPINARSKRIIQALVAGRTVTRGRLGAGLVPLTPEVARRQDVTAGVTVSQVEANGPAANAGLKVGDVIVAFGQQQITSPGQLVDLVQDSAPGLTIQLHVVRDGRPLTLNVVVGTLTPQRAGIPAALEGVRTTSI